MLVSKIKCLQKLVVVKLQISTSMISCFHFTYSKANDTLQTKGLKTQKNTEGNSFSQHR